MTITADIRRNFFAQDEWRQRLEQGGSYWEGWLYLADSAWAIAVDNYEHVLFLLCCLKGVCSRTGVVGKGQPPGEQTRANKTSVRSPALAALACFNTVHDVPHDDHDPIHVSHISFLSNLILQISRPRHHPSNPPCANPTSPFQRRTGPVSASPPSYMTDEVRLFPHIVHTLEPDNENVAQRSTPTPRYPCSTPSPTSFISLQHLPASARL